MSNAEYDNTIRDLTGIDIRPTREFPVDPANQSGFDNSGESLTMSPALLKKYLAAARHVADHVVLKPEGFVFAPHPVVTETDRDRYCVQRIIDFYKRHEIDLADYFHAAWQYQHREKLGKGDHDLARIATDAGLSPKYSRSSGRRSRKARSRGRSRRFATVERPAGRFVAPGCGGYAIWPFVSASRSARRAESERQRNSPAVSRWCCAGIVNSRTNTGAIPEPPPLT